MITLYQLYKLGENVDIDIFEDLTLPLDSPLNREMLINCIMEHCGMNIPLYADPHIFKNAVAVWSFRHQYTFIHVGKIYNADYSPIENKYYVETVDFSKDRDLTDNTTGTRSENTGTENTINRTVNNTGEDTVTDESTTSAYNSSNYQPEDKNTTTTEYGKETTDNTTNNATIEKAVNTSDDKTVSENETNNTTTFGHGNVGVTSNNALQIEDYSMIKDYNPYTFLCGLFENDLTLTIY